jgi:hypothetical protein
LTLAQAVIYDMPTRVMLSSKAVIIPGGPLLLIALLLLKIALFYFYFWGGGGEVMERMPQTHVAFGMPWPFVLTNAKQHCPNLGHRDL